MTLRPSGKFVQVLHRLWILGIAGFFILFAIAKAVKTAITGDELGTYFSYISSNIPALFNFGSSANNHVLNTLLAKFFTLWAGTSELVLRLPNLLAYVVYLLFSFLILDRFIKNKNIVVCGYLLLNLNPYVLDFFCLCRGYGLSLGFLMPALFFFFSFLEKTAEGKQGGVRHLQISLVAASLAVVSYFGLLNVYLSLVVCAFVFLIIINIHGRRRLPLEEPPQNKPKKKIFFWPAIILAAVLFNLLVSFQDFALVQNLFEPVAVRMTGLDEEDRQNIHVSRVDIQNQEEELSQKQGLWQLEKPAYFTAVRFRCRPEVLSKIQKIEISIGQKIFSTEATDIQKSKSDPAKKEAVFTSPDPASLRRSIFPMFKPVINWRGDGPYLKVLLLRMLLIAGIAALASAFILIIGGRLRRQRLLRAEQFRPLAWTTLALGLFIGYPFYVLRRSGEFYYGGKSGLIPDTVYSLIRKSFYGNTYTGGQDTAVFVLVCLFVLCSLIVLSIYYRKNFAVRALPGTALLAILALSVVSTIIQRALLGTAYLSGRTAVFFVPLFMLLLIFLIYDLCRLKKNIEIIATGLMLILTILFVSHFCLTANTTKTMEWKVDADTKSMLADLEDLKNRDAVLPARIRLGVRAGFNASVRYYIQRKKWSWLEVRIAPPYRGNDYYYLGDNFDLRQQATSPMILIKRYPFSGTILLRPKPE